ncbi:MAG: type I-C CRISPR-associated protein Cas5c [Bacillota bacterium]|nr:type I-C CRISPR-associated protein Cas5c [Bacillota bacterium]
MTYRNTVEFKVYGDYALFTDPLTKGGEKMSYQLPTYEAIKGVLSSVYWKPTIVWIIDKVRVIRPIQTQRKGVRPIHYSGGNELAYYTYLKDVEYQVEAHFEWNLNRPEMAGDRNEHKHHNIAKRMIERGGRRDIYLGCRECQGYVEPCEFGLGKGYYDDIEELAFGLMFHGFTYADEAVRDEDRDGMTVRLWRPLLEKGVLTFLRPEECTATRRIKDMELKKFSRELENFSPAEHLLGGELLELD